MVFEVRSNLQGKPGQIRPLSAQDFIAHSKQIKLFDLVSLRWNLNMPFEVRSCYFECSRTRLMPDCSFYFDCLILVGINDGMVSLPKFRINS